MGGKNTDNKKLKIAMLGEVNILGILKSSFFWMQKGEQWLIMAVASNVYPKFKVMKSGQEKSPQNGGENCGFRVEVNEC